MRRVIERKDRIRASLDKLVIALFLALLAVIAFVAVGCADRRPGDLAPDQIKAINRAFSGLPK